MQSERSWTQRPHVVRLHSYELSRVDKSLETEGLVVTRGWESGEGGVTANGYWVSFWGDDKVLEVGSGGGWPTL